MHVYIEQNHSSGQIFCAIRGKLHNERFCLCFCNRNMYSYNIKPMAYP
ncbi:hypothetical protein [Vibrio phage vB_VpaS_AL-2]|nr:hypothetical protein [Vibrio phage vB_VpaS_AL-2]